MCNWGSYEDDEHKSHPCIWADDVYKHRALTPLLRKAVGTNLFQPRLIDIRR